MLELLAQVEETAKGLIGKKATKIDKVKVKCWVHHSASRIKNGNPPFNYNNFSRNIGRSTYLDYINLDLIDCTDIGGKDGAVHIVKQWYGF